MDPYSASDHPISMTTDPLPPEAGPNHNVAHGAPIGAHGASLHEQHLAQLHQSIQQQQQQLHQQLTTGTSSIQDLIGMLPQTASLPSPGSPGSQFKSNVSNIPALSHYKDSPQFKDLPPGAQFKDASLKDSTHSHFKDAALAQYKEHQYKDSPLSPLYKDATYKDSNLALYKESSLSQYKDSDLSPSYKDSALSQYKELQYKDPYKDTPYSKDSSMVSQYKTQAASLAASNSPPTSHSQYKPEPSHALTHSYRNEPHSSSMSYPQQRMPVDLHTPHHVSQGGAPPYSLTPDLKPEASISSIAYTRQGDSFVCSLCGKVVVSKAAITRHIQLTHEKKKPFECNICHRRFGYKNILMEHQNIHFGIKPYACTLCDKRFAARSNLFQHRLLHMKPYCCYICSKRFDRDDQLQRHLKLHPTANILSCSQCPFTANNVESLNTHLQETHKLMTYDTRRHSSSFDSDDTPSSQSPAYPSDPETSRRIDTICSQLASRSNSAEVKQEPTSPGTHFPPDSPHHYPQVLSPRDPQQASPTSTSLPSRHRIIPYSTTLPHPTSLPRSHSIPADDPAMRYSGLSPNHGVESPKFPGAPRFLPPNRRANSLTNMASMRSPPELLRPSSAVSSEHVRSMADSTSNLSEFFSSLQGLVRRAQDIPELQLAITKPKQTAEVSTQATAHPPGDAPALEDLLALCEAQGKLYRCQHCRLAFEERGLYFLHKSLHGEASPWQCSICGHICADRNDFHLHFVNQQHSNEHT